MHLQRVRDALHKDLNRKPAIQRFLSAARGEPALSVFASPEGALALLHDREGSAAVRNDVVVALLRTVQRSRAPEALSLLVVAFAPGLIRVRRGLASVRDTSLDVLVLEAFVETVHAFPLE